MNIFLLSLSSSAAFPQHVAGIEEKLWFIRNCAKHYRQFHVHRVSSLFVLGTNSRKDDLLIVVSPSPLSILFCFVARIRGVKVYHWLHEPAPLQFLAKDGLFLKGRKLLKTIILAYLYNPSIVLVSNALILSSAYSRVALSSSLLGLLVNLFDVDLCFCPLPYPCEVLSQYCSVKKYPNVAICGSLNEDKGVDLLIKLLQRERSVPVSVLCTKAAYHSNPALNLLKEYPNVAIRALDSVSDSEIYEHISSASAVFLGYSAITQSGILPLALCFGTIPIVNCLPSFALEFWDYPDLVSVMPACPEDARGFLANSLSCAFNPVRSKIYFISGQLRALEFLCHATMLDSAKSKGSLKAYSEFLSCIFDVTENSTFALRL